MKSKKITDYKGDLEGINFLRRLVRTFDYRNEILNDNKTPIQLINEFLKVENGITDIDGNTVEE